MSVRVLEAPAKWRPRVGLVCVYFSLFDEQMPPDFRERQARTAVGYRQVLEAHADVVYPGLVASEADGRRCASVLEAAAVDLVVLAPTMAAPPAYAAAAIEGLNCPVIIWNAPMTEMLDPDLDQASAHEHTTLVSAVMLGNVLCRQGRPAVAVTASPANGADVARLVAMVRGSAARALLHGAVALRVGAPLPGYTDVEATQAELQALGVVEHAVDAADLREAVERPDEGELASIGAELQARGWSGRPDARSTRLAAALWTLVTRTQASCGTVNCHGPLLRENPEIGIAACLGVSICTGRSVPFSCTGDMPTALALLLGQRLAGAALYCEFFAPDLVRQLVLVANGGEGDPAWAMGQVKTLPSTHYPGCNGAGAAVSFALPPGPATVLSLSPSADGWRCVWSVGEVVESSHPRMVAPNAMFRLAGERDFKESLDAWIASGATHHNALLPGDVSDELTAAARVLGMEAHHV